MLTLRDSLKVFIKLAPVDMRKSINGLTALVADELTESPQSGHVFVFYNKARDKVKLVYWDRNGFALHYKRLDKGRFKMKNVDGVDECEVSEQQLNWLLAGLDFDLMGQFNELKYDKYY